MNRASQLASAGRIPHAPGEELMGGKPPAAITGVVISPKAIERVATRELGVDNMMNEDLLRVLEVIQWTEHHRYF